MKIALAHSRLHSAGGGERSVLELGRRLASKHHVTIYTSEYVPATTYPGLADLPIVILPAWQWATTRLHEEVIFTFTYRSNPLAYRNKHVAFYVLSFMSEAVAYRPDILLRRLLVKEMLKRNQRILAMSQFIAERFQALYQQPVSDVVYGGIGPDLFALPAQSGTYALYVGRFEPGKGLDRLIAWWQHIDYDLVLVGGGDPAYVRSLQQCNNPRITIRAPQFGEELAHTYQHCRFFVFLPYCELLGLVALEAMAAAKPVIAANAGGLVETILHGTTGFLVNSEAEFRQAATHLIASEQACQVMGAAARQHVQQFTWDNVASRLEQIAQDMLDS
jgi:glycosyltransferase involved in cell wall biosynthesis